MQLDGSEVKILFFAHNKRHYNFFLKVASQIKDKKGCKVNCQVITDNEYLPPDKSANFNARILFEMGARIEIKKEIKRIKEEYPEFNILATLLGDRALNYFPRYLGSSKIKRGEQEAYLVATFRVFEKELEINPVDIIISELVIGLQDAVLCAVAKRRKIQYVGMRASKLGSGIVFCDPYTEIPLGFQKKFLQFRGGADEIPKEHFDFASEHLNQIRSKYAVPVYMNETAKKSNYIEKHFFRRFFEVLGGHLSYNDKAHFFYLRPWQLIKYRLIRITNLWRLRHGKCKFFFAKPEELRDKKYIIFPLQFEPEATTLVRSYPYTDQINLAKQISKMLPDDVLLAVKEHRGNEGYRKISDYKELYYEPNIILLPRIMEVSEFIRGSCGVITLSGRMGWEALVLYKPVFVLGRAFWTEFEGVRKLKSLEDLFLYNSFFDLTYDNKEYTDSDLITFASAYHAKTYNGVFLGKSPRLLEDFNINQIAESICEFVFKDGLSERATKDA
jgi:hypothetical protein